MESTFKIKTSKKPILFHLTLIFGSCLIGFMLFPSTICAGFFLLGLGLSISLPFTLYYTLFTNLSIEEDTLVGSNGLFSRIKTPINRITVVTVVRNPLKVGGRGVILLTKSRDLIKIRYVLNYDDLIDTLEELNPEIIVDNRFHINRY